MQAALTRQREEGLKAKAGELKASGPVVPAPSVPALEVVRIDGVVYCAHGRVGGYLCPHCPITPDGKSANDLAAEMNKLAEPTAKPSPPKPLADILQDATRKLDGLPPGHAHWGRMLFMIGKAWQHYELSEADASALQDFLRQLRFPRK